MTEKHALPSLSQQDSGNFLGESSLENEHFQDASGQESLSVFSMQPPPFQLQASSEEEQENEAPMQLKASGFSGGGPVQRGKAEVRSLLGSKAKFATLLAKLEANEKLKGRSKKSWRSILRPYVGKAFKDFTAPEKIALAEAWNKRLKGRQKLTVLRLAAPKPKLKDLSPAELEKLSGMGGWAHRPPGLSRRDSGIMEGETWEGFLEKVKTGRQISVYNPSNGSHEVLEVLSSASNAARLVRLFWHNQKKRGSKDLRGRALFAFNRGMDYGIFEDRGLNDVIYTPLRTQEFETISGGKEKYSVRDGKTFRWSDIAEELKGLDDGKGKIKQEILDVLLRRGAHSNPKVLEAVGAMICDAKYSMTGFLSLIEKLERSSETDPTKLFSSESKDHPVWTPSAGGGRKESGYVRDKLLYEELESGRVYTGGRHEMDRDGSVPPPKSKIGKVIEATKVLRSRGLDESKTVKYMMDKRPHKGRAKSKFSRESKKSKSAVAVLPELSMEESMPHEDVEMDDKSITHFD